MPSFFKEIKLGALPFLNSSHDDDLVDRFNHRYTVFLLLAFCLVVTVKRYVGDPILCWHPKHFEKIHEEYANSYCWVTNTYYLPLEDDIPAESETWKRKVVPYYQWVSIILLVQAFLFHLPYAIWTMLGSNSSGIDLARLIDTGQSYVSHEMDEIRRKLLAYMTMMVHRYLRCHMQNTVAPGSSSSPSCCNKSRSSAAHFCRAGRANGNYLVLVYTFVKLLYVLNAVGQLIYLDLFVLSGLHRFGIDVLQGTAHPLHDWPAFASTRFPRSTMCDMKVRRLGNVHRYTLQCVLPINLFNEKIFLFMYIWLIFLVVVNVASMFVWIWRFSCAPVAMRYVERLRSFETELAEDKNWKAMKRRYVYRYLGPDGVFILRLIAHNTNPVTVAFFELSLFDNFRKKVWEEELIKRTVKPNGHAGTTKSRDEVDSVGNTTSSDVVDYVRPSGLSRWLLRVEK